jgi:hypothetical protein
MNRVLTLVFHVSLTALPLASAAELSDSDFAVWRAVISSALPKQPAGRVYIWGVAERSEVYDYGAMQGFRSSMRELTDQLFSAYNTRNDLRPPLELADHFGLTVPVTLFGQDDAQKHLGHHLDFGWVVNPRLLPDACLVTRLSLPAYSRDTNTAFVFASLCVPTRFDQTYFILRRTKESWRIVERKTWWHSDTSDYTSTQ